MRYTIATLLAFDFFVFDHQGFFRSVALWTTSPIDKICVSGVKFQMLHYLSKPSRHKIVRLVHKLESIADLLVSRISRVSRLYLASGSCLLFLR